MEPIADVDIQLKVSPKCGSCLMKVIEVMHSVRGVYDVGWDVRQEVVRVSGEVDPTILLKAIFHAGEHAELVNVKLKHPQLRRTKAYYDSNYNTHGYYGTNYDAYGTNYTTYGTTSGQLPSYRYGSRSLPDHPYYETNLRPQIRSAAIEYPSSYTTSYDYTGPLPPATYVPSYPPQEYRPYNEYEGMSYCTIM